MTEMRSVMYLSEMRQGLRKRKFVFTIVGPALLCVLGCDSRSGGAGRSPAATESAVVQATIPAVAPPASSTGGFDGAKAFEHVRKLVEIGPRPPGSDGIHRAQDYIIGQLKGFGCQVEEHDFHGSTPLGDIAMKNIVAKIPGAGRDIVLYTTHYDTLRMANFVGADDGGSGTGTMLELARVFCSRQAKSALTVWIVFFDGEEAQNNWTDKNSVQWMDTNSTFGSREMAASMALAGDLERVKAMILADMIGSSDLRIKRDTGSTPWLVDLIWATAAQLAYQKVFLDEPYTVGGDDHFSFIRRGVPGCDIIDFDIEPTYWHTPEDTLDKVDPRSLAIVGHVLMETLPALEKKFHGHKPGRRFVHVQEHQNAL
jgi:glutaminyl-peptide cyclotransferase